MRALVIAGFVAVACSKSGPAPSAAQALSEKPPESPPEKPPEKPPAAPGVDHFAGFSSDGRFFAWAALSHGAGVPVLTFLRSADDAIDGRVALEAPADVDKARRELSARGFAAEGVRAPAAGLAELRGGKLAVEFSGAMPATLAPRFVPPNARATLWGTSADGRWAAVQLTGQAQSEFGDVLTYEIVSLQR